MKSTTKSKPTAVADKLDLTALAERCWALHQSIESKAEILEVCYVEMFNLLTQARDEVGHGGWLKWLANNKKILGFGERQAQYYLREPEARASDLARHAEGEKKRRAQKKAVEPESMTLEQIEAESTKKIIAELRRYVGFLEGRRTVTPEQIKSLCDVRDQINAVIE